MESLARLAMTVRRDEGRRFRRGLRSRGGVVSLQDATLVQTPVLIPSVEGCRPQAAGWFPPQDAPPSKPPSLIFDI
ncbi:MAG: hypothetical protein LBM98_04745 [Oscillospiraceae bacterium]|nr:hypothetical protein [Oscillospiraceae bacterium]